MGTVDVEQQFGRMVQGELPDPRPLYAALRETAPVYRSPFGFWYVTRYDLANAVLRDDSTWSVSPATAGVGEAHHDGFAAEVMARSILNLDGVDHNRLRRLVSTIFTGRAAERLRGKVEAAVQTELDALAGRTDVELVHDFALLLPTKVILDVLGIGHEHADTFVAVADALIAMHEPTATEATLRASDRAFRAAADVATDLAVQRRAEPRDDLMTALVQTGGDTEPLREDELVSLVLTLVIAGHETTANTLCTGLYHLLEHPAALAALRADRTQLTTAVEELLRYDAATRNSVGRFATRDTELGGETVRRGDKLYVSLHGANHDPAEFDRPLDLDVRRAPNRHIGFGGGGHYCLGAALARMELQVALGALLDRYALIELAGQVAWRPSFIIRGLTALPLRVAPG